MVHVADIRFNNGRGALLCNLCGTMIDYGFDWEDKLHFCSHACELKFQEQLVPASLESMGIDPGLHEFTQLETLLIQQVISAMEYDDANPEVGMGPACWMTLNDVLRAHNIPKESIAYTEVLRKIEMKRAGLA